ncbi:MAG: hypothetical protein ABIA92_04165 [Patescibacteria group bacterium]
MPHPQEITWFAADQIRDQILVPAYTRGTTIPGNESETDLMVRISETGCLHEIPREHYDHARESLQHVCEGTKPYFEDMFAIEADSERRLRFYIDYCMRLVTRLLTKEETARVQAILADPPKLRVVLGEGDGAKEMTIY